MGRKFIFDRSDIGGSKRTAQGFLRVPGFATRVGVFNYRTIDGEMIGVLRLPQEVFAEDSMDSLKSIPVTVMHPKQFVTSVNAKEVMRGYTSDSVEKIADTYLKTDLIVTDADAIAGVESKAYAQLSCGYTCDLEDNEGIFQGLPYQKIQRNIRYNHLALVDKGRAGPQVRVLMDAAEGDEIYVHTTDDDTGEINMVKVMIGGKEFNVSPEVKAALEAHMATMSKEGDASKEAAVAKQAEEAKKMDTAQATIDGLNEKITTLAKQVTDAAAAPKDEVVRKAARDRANLLKVADGLDVKDSDTLSDRDLKVACIKKGNEKFDATDKSDDYVNARFDVMREDKGTTHALQSSAKRIARGEGSETVDSAKAFEKSVKESDEAWKQPLSITVKK